MFIKAVSRAKVESRLQRIQCVSSWLAEKAT
jgi:hypothetical protein